MKKKSTLLNEEKQVYFKATISYDDLVLYTESVKIANFLFQTNKTIF